MTPTSPPEGPPTDGPPRPSDLAAEQDGAVQDGAVQARTEQDRVRLWTRATTPFILSALALMSFIAIEAFAVTTVLPVAMADLEATSWYSFAFAATIATALVGMVVGGTWSDRSGPLPPLLAGGTLFLLGLALCALAPGPSVFILGRALQGVGGGIDSVVLYVMIARTIPAPARPAMFGLLTTAWLLPSLLGPVGAGLLAQLTTWRTVFAAILAGSALALAGLLRTARTAPADDADGSADGASRILGRPGLLALAASGLLLVLHVMSRLPGLLAPVVVLGGLVALVPVARGLLPPGTLHLRGPAQQMVVLRAGFGVLSVVTNAYLTLYLQSQRGLTPTAAGLILAAGAGGWAFGAWLQARWPSSLSEHRRQILRAAPLVALGPLAALLLTLHLVPVGVIVPASVLLGMGMGIASSRTSTATLDLAPVREQGAYSSALQSGESMAVAAATAVMATVLALRGGDESAYVLVYLALTAVAGLLILLAFRTRGAGAAGEHLPDA
ncbi:MFS transporter [Brachybacterium sp. AOP43-C2-M15]|uniref:MFS transporter n=1 Tax=Brachybacterium sp. AOP43-C2-M15 TaxID=3457661 RepID=UPI0040345B96